MEVLSDVADGMEALVATCTQASKITMESIQDSISTMNRELTDKHSVTQPQVASAQAVWKDDAAVAPLIARVKVAMRKCVLRGGDATPTCTEEELVAAIKTNADATLGQLRARKALLLKSGLSGKEAAAAFQAMLNSDMPKIAQAAYAKAGMTMAEFQRNMVAHSGSPAVDAAVAEAAALMSGPDMAKVMQF